MGGQITALRIQRRNRQRVNVYLDGRFAFGLTAMEAARLRVGQFLSDEDIARLRQRDAAERAAEQALDLLSYRPRSEAEIRERLSDRYGAETTGEVLERLRRTGLVDDREFAHYWVQNRFQHNPRGVVVLRQELRRKGVDDSAIEEALADYDEEAAAIRAAETACRKLRGLAPDTFRRRLTDYLLRRGFPYGIVQSIIQQFQTAAGSEDSAWL
ncbi:MAG: RecX family transcriptional regulator [Anaerolineae bacterium]|nr:RecX family transcriptional regulator [Anaerolineae bacterium]MDW8068228.1 RecX family transcriptional regulator [Anaerolineae bacterium]